MQPADRVTSQEPGGIPAPGVAPDPAPASPEAALEEARRHERNGRVSQAIRSYEAAAAGDAPRVTVESLRRLAVMHHQSNRREDALRYCRLSYEGACRLDDHQLMAEALNTRAGFDLEAGAYDSARQAYTEALRLGGGSLALRGRIQQNLGILANIRGDLSQAAAHYGDSLDAFRAMGDERGCAIAYHNLGMLSADRERWEEADEHFRRTLEIAEAIGDVQLRGLGLLNRTEVLLAVQQYQDARQSAEAALTIFDRLGAKDGKAAAYRFLGMLYRETGSPALAEARLRQAMELASQWHYPLEEAEATRELAVLCQGVGRNQEALRLLNGAHRLFRRLEAAGDVVDIAGRVTRLEDTYLTVVRDWGESIESADSYTYGHCERVAGYALSVALALKLPEDVQTTIRLGAYLHDVGKVRVPHEILNKPGRLTPQEFEIIKQHPLYGLELLGAIDFPWDIKPIIRWHHEKLDGSGYPDGLRGDEIPLDAQIICIADVFDALTTTRSYKPAHTPEAAMQQMRECRHWWRPDVFEAFMSGRR